MRGLLIVGLLFIGLVSSFISYFAGQKAGKRLGVKDGLTIVAKDICDLVQYQDEHDACVKKEVARYLEVQK